MKQIIMLTMLTLGMICINVSAQTKKPVRGTATQMRKNTATSKPVQKDSREYKVEDDGFEWYLVCKNGKYGAESRDGIMLVPTEYTKVVYFDGFHTYMGEYSGYYNIKGKCIIPYNRQYNSILKKKRGLGEKEYDVFIVNKCKREDGRVVGEGLCDINGKEVIYLHGMCHIYPYTKNGLFYFTFNPLHNINIEGVADGKCNVIISPTEMTKEPILYDRKEEVFYSGYSSKEGRLAQIPSSNLTYNPLLNSFETASSLTTSGSFPSSNSSSSSNNSNSSNTNSGNSTTTIVVEQHGPVQVWMPCGGCQLSPGRCSYCNGSGWGYNNRLCSRCNGTGKCTICNGTGGHNEVQYR